jgi:hypothetical protein
MGNFSPRPRQVIMPKEPDRGFGENVRRRLPADSVPQTTFEFARHLRLDLNISALERTPQFVIAVAWFEIRRSRQNKLTDVGDFSDQAQLSGGLSPAAPIREYRGHLRSAA